MTREELKFEATRFRRAIEKAKADGEFVPKKPLQSERMNNFPHDCCDDTADLFTHYLYHEFRIDSIRIGLNIADLDLLTIGCVYDMFNEKSRDSMEWKEQASQSDFDKF